MRLPSARSSASQLTVVLGFVTACGLLVAYLWAQAGGDVPGITQAEPYHLSIDVPNVRNLVPFSDVEIAGVTVGKVEHIDRVGDQARLDLQLDGDAAPMHAGIQVQVTEKSLIGTYGVTLTDGHGTALPSGAVLPPSSVKPPVDLRDVLASLDAPTRSALGGLIRSLGAGTSGREHDISAVMSGLADLGGNGSTAVDAIAAQSGDLRTLINQMNTLFDTLDTGQGQIVQVVNQINQLSAATAGQRQAIDGTIRRLPEVLNSTQVAAGDVTKLSTALKPVAADLAQAAPGLTEALVELPATTRDLRGLLPSLSGTLDRAPATLNRIPAVGADARALIPQAMTVLQDLNPMLRYLKPYGLDLSQLFTDFGAAFHHRGQNGETYLDVQAVQNPYALTPNPVTLPPGLLANQNPYPAPGGLADRTPGNGTFPHVQRDH
jgi:phospholipid/cholesterol/gamma-HCH transport system substrate-binding protein